MHRKRRSFLLDATARVAMPLVLWAASLSTSHAQSTSAPAGLADLSGQTLSGKSLSLLNLRGKVVVVWFWSTTCAVCRDVLPELRSNYAGWQGKPFELVTVATDAAREDVVQYERIVQSVVSSKEAPPALWRRDPRHRDNFPASLTLPTAFLLDSSGRVVERYAGRIPAQAWDRIAELLP